MEYKSTQNLSSNLINELINLQKTQNTQNEIDQIQLPLVNRSKLKKV
jgi:hypothetical protein